MKFNFLGHPGDYLGDFFDSSFSIAKTKGKSFKILSGSPGEEGVVAIVRGYGFTYDEETSELLSGTVRSIKFFDAGSANAKITGVEWDALEFTSAAAKLAEDDDSGFLTLLGLQNLTIDAVRADAGLNMGAAQISFLDGLKATVKGSDYDDALVGGLNVNSVLKGAAGDDRILGLFGDDKIYGNTGDDNLAGAWGNDKIFGGAGKDDLTGGDGNDLLFGGRGADDLGGGPGDDKLYGGTGRDTLSGGEGNDSLFGQKGSDYLSGSLGDDRIFGGGGGDTIIGDAGKDIMTGGIGKNIFVYHAFSDSGLGEEADVITDFVNGVDKIDLSDAPLFGLGAVHEIEFLGTDDFVGGRYGVRYERAGFNTIVEFGDTAGHMEIVLLNTSGVTESDFIL